MKVSRRAFLASSATAAVGGALVIGFRLHGHRNASEKPAQKDPFDAWIHIHPDGTTILMLEKCEMGQGIYTGLPMVLADEAELDWKTVRIEQSLASSGTGGSGSTSGGYLPLRRAGAVVREAMIGAAALRWGVSRESCSARQSRVLHPPSGRSLGYGELVADARKLPLPGLERVRLKDPSEFALIGHEVPARDIPPKTMGDARFGFDVRLPGMVFAMVVRCPIFGGKVKDYDASRTLAVPGVLEVFEVEPRGFQVHTAGGVVIVARTTWAAMQGRKALTVTWDSGPYSKESSDLLRASLYQALAVDGKTIQSDGETVYGFASVTKQIEAVYEFPFLAHATMEPMNTTIQLKGDRCEVWCPSQSPDWAQSAIAKELGFKLEQVVVHTTFMGGGFGRRYIGDYPTEAAQIARHVDGPVQLVWSREDDMTHDFYRPASCHKMRGALGHDGRIAAWSHHIASTSIRTYWDPPETVQPESAEIGSAVNPPYPMVTFKLAYTPVESAVPRGWWRSVEHSSNGFVVECFVDELAIAASQDPYLFRKALLMEGIEQRTKRERGPDLTRLMAVLDLAAEKAGWGKPTQKNQGRGIACGTAYGYLAQVAEVTVQDGNIQVDRIVTAVDCGQVVNPVGVRQQIEGGIVFALSAILKGEITLAGGQIQQTNFNSYDLVRMPESPHVEVYLMDNHFDPSGIGEAGVPYLGPAVANAIFAATGKRLRKLPFRINESS